VPVTMSVDLSDMPDLITRHQAISIDTPEDRQRFVASIQKVCELRPDAPP
jgi:hypothetical protein